MTPLFIASRFIPHDGSRRVLATGRVKGGSSLVQIQARAGDLASLGTGLRRAGALEAVKRADREAWRIHQQRRELR